MFIYLSSSFLFSFLYNTLFFFFFFFFLMMSCCLLLLLGEGESGGREWCVAFLFYISMLILTKKILLELDFGCDYFCHCYFPNRLSFLVKGTKTLL